jgi:hypothetical protein
MPTLQVVSIKPGPHSHKSNMHICSYKIQYKRILTRYMRTKRFSNTRRQESNEQIRTNSLTQSSRD